MNVLLIGSGAREHAIAKAINRSKIETFLYCLGSNMNPGIAELCNEFTIGNINDPQFVVNYGIETHASLAIIGPENPLACGVSDALWENNIKTIGPRKELAKIETSKAFTRELLKQYKIPGGPDYKVFSSMSGVLKFLDHLGDKYVVKYDGLAGGKGVKVSGDHLFSHDDALKYCQKLVDSGGEFVIEEKFIGQEFSLMSFCDGSVLKHMPAVQDHKRAYEGDSGPNTGGMGTYSDFNHSLPFLSEGDILEARSINEATASALKDKFNESYQGVLYGGFIATADGVKLIEYNARFGDPEAINVLSLLDSDIVEIFEHIVNGTLNNLNIKFKNKATVCKYAVPKGYPDDPVKGQPIDISKVTDPNSLFLASVDIKNNSLVESGSRTVASIGIADTIEEAESIAEKEISLVSGPLFHRKDIGTKAVIQSRVDYMNFLR